MSTTRRCAQERDKGAGDSTRSEAICAPGEDPHELSVLTLQALGLGEDEVQNARARAGGGQRARRHL